MQIGIDLGATKIESVLLKENGLELHRDRIQSPKNYLKTIILKYFLYLQKKLTFISKNLKNSTQAEKY